MHAREGRGEEASLTVTVDLQQQQQAREPGGQASEHGQASHKEVRVPAAREQPLAGLVMGSQPQSCGCTPQR